MPINHAMWAHGHSMAVENPSALVSEWRAGFFIRTIGRAGSTNWFHFGIPTPVIVDDDRLTIDSALVRLKSAGRGARVTHVHVFDGERRVAAHDGLSVAPTGWEMLRWPVPGRPEVLWGVGVTLGVAFSGASDAENTLELASAGVDFFG
ncbi:hypothetical protein LEP48_06085 [Isoptericola sp. NEAU-Y5]|uniref:Uncharacterized protein n=1 Tax=Isoptericola luteus TaxID=2879484 RepID=A0ABS7ZCZ3_9MICO|nr:DUF6623 family protein [Isoptericola sp. NEAU-Y5]MCA5892923.1 hypothetical protein [Isoptericola sp. NEAU-Y5]